MAWHGSEQGFEKNKHYLQSILEGQRIFVHKSPASLARTVRGLLKYVRERKDTYYESIWDLRVVQTKHGIRAEERDETKIQNRIHVDSTLYDMLIALNNPVPNSKYIFPNPQLKPGDLETLEKFCYNSKLDLKKSDYDYIEVRT